MNIKRRKRIESCVINLQGIIDELEMLLSDEQSAYDNMPENLQYSQRGEESEESIDNMEEAMDGLGNALDELKSAVDVLTYI